MVSNFKYITFSIFHVSGFQKVIDVVKDIFKEELEDGKADIYAEIPVVGSAALIPIRPFSLAIMKMAYLIYVN